MSEGVRIAGAAIDHLGALLRDTGHTPEAIRDAVGTRDDILSRYHDIPVHLRRLDPRQPLRARSDPAAGGVLVRSDGARTKRELDGLGLRIQSTLDHSRREEDDDADGARTVDQDKSNDSGDDAPATPNANAMFDLRLEITFG